MRSVSSSHTFKYHWLAGIFQMSCHMSYSVARGRGQSIWYCLSGGFSWRGCTSSCSQKFRILLLWVSPTIIQAQLNVTGACQDVKMWHVNIYVYSSRLFNCLYADWWIGGPKLQSECGSPMWRSWAAWQMWSMKSWMFLNLTGIPEF